VLDFLLISKIKGEQMAEQVLSNQKTIIGNQATIVKNQKAILANQSTITKNQKAILANQGVIKKNQSALGEILKNQKLILAALKDRDIAARGRGVMDGIGEPEIIEMMQKMVRQRHESIELYQRGGRPELAQQEADEIAIIEGYLPKQLDEAEAIQAVDAVVAELGATNLKDMGRVMAALKERFGGRMDFGKAGARVKQKLG